MNLNDLDNPALTQVKSLTQSKQFWTNLLAAFLMVSSMFGWHVSLEPAAAADTITSFFAQTYAWFGAAAVIATQVSTIFRVTSDGARIVGFLKPPTRPTSSGWV
jgi:hypothetical protein